LSSLALNSLCVRRIGVGLIVLLCAVRMFAFAPDTPVTPGASPEAQSLLAFFTDTYGKKIISGQQDGWRHTNGLSIELNYITNTTGKLPALLAMDLSGYTAKPLRPDPDHRVAREAMNWFDQRHGIVELCCHWRAPMDQPEFYSKDTTFDIRRAVTEGTPEYAATERDLDVIAAQLEVLRDAHIPVLWRPLHEANGRWFWWGMGGPEPFKQLWHMMFENFTIKHHLNNLIWVFSPGAETDLAAWYPGDAYVDIVGQDHYPLDGNHGPVKDVFDELNSMTRGEKLVALGENGPLPDPALVLQTKAGWLFFTTWSGSILFEKTTPVQLRDYYNNPYVLNLSDLPDLRNYPFRPAGKAVKLDFRGAPGNVAINGTWRMPVTVAVEDNNGETVRDGNYRVTLALKDSANATLSGSLTAGTVNGVADFNGVTINAPVQDCEFVATADGLQDASSPAFEVGPGDGLLRQWWIAKNSLTELPDDSEILGKALETPVSQATNFSARITGWLLPPETGTYQFSVAGGGEIELWLSTDDSPTKVVEIAGVTRATPYRKWPHASETDSQPVALAAGKKYYLEIRQRQDNGSTQLHVRWRLPDGTEERPIPAFRFDRPQK
jgi:mannan endo-1,4-beta-mannosidase